MNVYSRNNRPIADSSRFFSWRCYQVNCSYCFLCGLYIAKPDDRLPFERKHAQLFEKEFGFAPRLNGVQVGRAICCECREKLEFSAEHNARFPVTPSVWRPVKPDHSDCWICNTKFDSVTGAVSEYPVHASFELPKKRVIVGEKRDLGEMKKRFGEIARQVLTEELVKLVQPDDPRIERCIDQMWCRMGA